MSSARITRRVVLGSAGAASLSPVLALSPRDPLAPRAQLAFAASIGVGPVETATHPERHWTAVLGGQIAGRLLDGAVQGGRIDWSINARGHAVEITAQLGVLSRDGRLLEIRDRAVFPGSGPPVATGLFASAPVLMEQGEQLPAGPALLVGRVDVSRFAQGVVLLQAYEVS